MVATKQITVYLDDDGGHHSTEEAAQEQNYRIWQRRADVDQIEKQLQWDLTHRGFTPEQIGEVAYVVWANLHGLKRRD